MKTCVIVFPLYERPNPVELSFLENGIRLTQGFKQVLVAPEGLQIDASFGSLEQLEVKRFSKHYFEGIKGYNQLLLSKGFYTTFSLFDYILIHQADVFLFKNELALWCEKNYDYIGAPWFRPDKLNRGFLFNTLQHLKLMLKKNKLYASRYNKVGNGGLSLRKVGTALKVLDTVPASLLKKYTLAEGPEFNEDIFWSLEAPAILSSYRIPEMNEAMHFAVEFEPTRAFQLLNQQLPFGCHAPLKHDIEFWKKLIPILQ
jgi:glycosyltransferase involved in cell wall biosynthesis